jgi:hypothetical protein
VVVTIAALAAGGCGTTSGATVTNFRILNMTPQTLMQQLKQPTTRGPGGYPVLAGPPHLSLLGIESTTQGNAALQSWLSTTSSNHAAYVQAGRNLARAFPQHKAEIDSKLGK